MSEWTLPEKQWPNADVCHAAQALYFMINSSWNGHYVTRDEIMGAFTKLEGLLFLLPERPEHLPRGRALLGPKMPEDCAAICALKGEKPDEPMA